MARALAVRAEKARLVHGGAPAAWATAGSDPAADVRALTRELRVEDTQRDARDGSVTHALEARRNFGSWSATLLGGPK